MPIEDDVVVPYLFRSTQGDSLGRHLNITHSLDDALIQSKLVAAMDWVSSYTGLAIEFYSDLEEGAEDNRPRVPPRVREAILMLAAHLYNNRETVLVGVTAQELPFGLLDMLSDYRAWCA